jgi:hypothetical protein
LAQSILNQVMFLNLIIIFYINLNWHTLFDEADIQVQIVLVKAIMMRMNIEN